MFLGHVSILGGHAVHFLDISKLLITWKYNHLKLHSLRWGTLYKRMTIRVILNLFKYGKILNTVIIVLGFIHSGDSRMKLSRI